jgi:hypothetical protein
MVIHAKGQAPKPEAAAGARYAPEEARSVTLTAIPYFAWDNRAPGEMLVWMPESLGLAEPPPDLSIHATASHCWQSDSPDALHDGLEPSSSADGSIPRLTFWPHKGTAEWAQYDFAKPRRVAGVEVYWFDDHAHGGGCATPASWRVLYKDGDEWKEAAGASACGVDADNFNSVRFSPVTTSGLRLEIKLRDSEKGFSAGILEWRVTE